MFSIFYRQPPAWAEEDLEAVAARLEADFPKMPAQLRRAILMLAAQELRPGRGRETLVNLATRYARGCPRTIGMEAALAS
jgi:hypothetical protein